MRKRDVTLAQEARNEQGHAIAGTIVTIAGMKAERNAIGTSSKGTAREHTENQRSKKNGSWRLARLRLAQE